MDRVLTKLEELVYEELDEIVKSKDISPAELDNATKAVCLLLKIRELDDGIIDDPEMRYSNTYPRRGHYSNGYEDGMYIIPEGRYYPSRYSNNYMDHTDNRWTTAYNGYSRHSIKDRAIDRLEKMIDETQSENEKESIKKMIVGLEHMELY